MSVLFDGCRSRFTRVPSACGRRTGPQGQAAREDCGADGRACAIEQVGDGADRLQGQATARQIGSGVARGTAGDARLSQADQGARIVAVGRCQGAGDPCRFGGARGGGRQPGQVRARVQIGDGTTDGHLLHVDRCRRQAAPRCGSNVGPPRHAQVLCREARSAAEGLRGPRRQRSQMGRQAQGDPVVRPDDGSPAR